MQKAEELLNRQQGTNDWLETENCLQHDILKFTKRLHDLAFERGFLVKKLGVVGSEPLFLLQSRELKDGPNLLIAAGFHGEEPAGCWGIIRFLESASEDLTNSSNISFLPLVNPTGFRCGKRTNDWGQNPNQGFCHTGTGRPEPSREGLILMQHLPLIKSLATDGFLSLHEDIELEMFYLYTFEDSDVPGPFSEVLQAEEAKIFRPYPDGLLEGGFVRNGIIFRHCDGSFEDFLFHEGIPRTACTETPGLLDINERIEANANIITAFLKFALSLQR